MKKFFATLAVLTLLLPAIMALPVLAEDLPGPTQEMGEQLFHTAGPSGANLPTPVDPRFTIVIIIKILLTLVGTVMVVLNIYAGFLWMTAGGNEEQIGKAKKILFNAILGLVITLSAYAITIAATNIATGRPLWWGTGWRQDYYLN